MKGGRQVDAFTYVWDIMPTILDMVEVAYPDKYVGRAVAPMRGRLLDKLLAGKVDRVYGDDDFIGADLGGNAQWGRRGDMKILRVSPPYGEGKWQLFDLSVDPAETRDLAAEQPETLAELIGEWEDYADQVGVIR